MQGGQWNGRRRHARFRRFRWGRLALIVVSSALIVFGAARLIGYRADLAASQKTAEALRQVYRQETEAPDQTTKAPVNTAAPTAPPTAVPEASSAPTATPAAALTALAYPDNPKAQISSRFKALRRENKDIIGWLSMGNLLDEAVVQRDDTYYMDHDALGGKNVNGAIFLDSSIAMKTRPFTYILYGHNMKTGAMFGCLRNYENVSYYRKNPFIAFDTMYENGRYVIFAVGTVNTEARVRNYLDFFSLSSMNIMDRQKAIDVLKAASVLTCTIDVQPDDQLLVLVTCVDRDEERRVVAARRIRDGEDEDFLKILVERSKKKQ